MHQIRLSLLLPPLLALLFAAATPAAEDFLPPDQAFPISARALDAERVEVQWRIAPGYYLYRDKISLRSASDGVRTGGAQLPEGEIKRDEFFGDVSILRGIVQVGLPLLRSGQGAQTVSLIAKSQGCADAGLCYPPHEQRLEVALPAVASEPPSIAQARPARNALLQPLADSAGGSRDEPLPVEQAFRLSAEAPSPDRLRLSWQVAPGTYLYQDKFEIRLKQGEGVALGAPRLPEPKIKRNAVRPDGSIGDLAVYDQAFSLDIPLSRDNPAPQRIRLEVAYQGCAEVGICYPPQRQELGIELAASGQASATSKAQQPAAAEPVNEQDQITQLLRGGNSWLILLSFFGIGLLLAFTPCVFPMIPILSGIIAGHGGDITTRKAFLLSLVYVLAMAVTYTLAGVLAGLFGQNLQAAFQNPWILGAFALVFVLLALSMFGYYDLQLPSSLQTRLGHLSNRQQGGHYAGVAVMGLLSALIVGPCVAPPLAGALIYIGQTGDALLGGLALFAMSLGMGLPLIAIGTGAGRLLPSTGAWMNGVKAAFGVMLLAVAILLLERVIPPQAAMLLWGLLLICTAIFLGALRPLPVGSPGLTRLWQGLGVAMLIYGALMLLGVALNGKDSLQPLRGLSIGLPGAAAEQPHPQFKRIKTQADLERELTVARGLGRAVMLDFYADWCTYCIQFEKYVFSDPKVRAVLDGLVLLQADVTANDEQDQALLRQMGIPAPPAILFWDRAGQERRNYRVMGYLDAEAFLAHLRRALP